MSGNYFLLTTQFGLTNCRRNHKENVTGLKFAGDAIKKAQVQQKQQQDAFAHSATLVEGERVIVYMPANSGMAYKFGKAIPWSIPYGSSSGERHRSQTSRPASCNHNLCGSKPGPYMPCGDRCCVLVSKDA